MNAREFVKKIQNKEIDVVEHTKNVISEIKRLNEEYHYFNVISEGLAIEQAIAVSKNPKGKLAGLPISVKDCIVVKDVESKAGSKILEGYIPVFDATVIEKVKSEGAIIIGKTSQDEFGFGSFSVNVGVGMEKPLNPFDKSRSCGGSSGGSGGITQKISFPHVSLGESTGGSIENPASFCGVIGFCPTYGLVSRYGLMDYANSLDKIGPMAKSMDDVSLLMDVISGYDKKDSTSLNVKVPDYSFGDVKGMKVGVIKEFLKEGVSPDIIDAINETIKRLKEGGAIVDEVSLPAVSKYSLATYYIIALSEASTNLAKYCGLRYGVHGKIEGNFNEYFSKVRSANITAEAKRRIILGTFARMSGFRDAYYIKAARVRTKIINEYKEKFKKFDVLISPVTATVAPKFDDIDKMTPLQNYMSDIMTVGPNLAGVPHMSYPIGKDKEGMPIGMMVIADHLNEANLIRLGGYLE